MTGYGRTGPKAEHPAYDLVVQAYSGMMALNGWDADAPPLRVGAPIIDYGTGAQAAFAISAAFTGLAGALFAHKIGYLAPDGFTLITSIQLLLMVVVGGTLSRRMAMS